MLLINNQDQERLVTIPEYMEVIEEAYLELDAQRAVNFPVGGRMDIGTPSSGKELGRTYNWGAMAGIIRKRGIMAVRMKSDISYIEEHPGGLLTREKYCIEPGTFCGLVLLFSLQNAEPLAILNDGIIQHMRVGATNGIITKYLAREDSEDLGILGSGGMARTHAMAICSTRPIKRIRVYSPTPANREAFAQEMSAKLEVPVEAVDRAEDAVRGMDIVATCTDSTLPVVEADWLEPGMHLSSVGSREFGPGAVEERVDVMFRHLPGGNVRVRALGDGPDEFPYQSEGDGTRIEDQDLPTLADLLSGKAPGRTNSQQITYLYNMPGSGIQFAAAGALLYERAKAQGIGRELPSEWFLQDIRD